MSGGPVEVPDDAIIRMRAELAAMKAIVDALEPFPPEARARILKAACILFGFDVALR